MATVAVRVGGGLRVPVPRKRGPAPISQFPPLLIGRGGDESDGYKFAGGRGPNPLPMKQEPYPFDFCISRSGVQRKGHMHIDPGTDAPCALCDLKKSELGIGLPWVEKLITRRLYYSVRQVVVRSSRKRQGEDG